MLALIAGPDTERPPSFFRYTVRADRARAKAIEAAAAKAGLSVETFVQRHFDRILDAPTGPAKKKPFDADRFVKKHGVRRIEALIYGELLKRADPDDGVSRASAADIAFALDLRLETVREALRALCDLDLAANHGSTGRHGNVYQLKGW